MKTVLLAAGTLALITSATVPLPKTVVSVNIKGLSNDTVLIYKSPVGESAASVPDTIISKNGVFTYDPLVDSPRALTIVPYETALRKEGLKFRPTFPATNIELATYPGEKIAVNATLHKEKYVYTEYTLTGSTLNVNLCNARKNWIELEKQALAMGRIMVLNLAPQAELEAMNQPYTQLLSGITAAKKQYIKDHPSDPASAFLLGRIVPELETDDLVSLEAKINPPVAQQAIKKSVQKAIDNRRKEAATMEIFRDAIENVVPGKMAPDFTLKDSKNDPFTLSAHRGKYVVIDFWGSWCKWCIVELPYLDSLYQKYKHDAVFVNIACFDKKESWRDLLTKHPTEWTQLLNMEDTTANDVTLRYGLMGYPTKIIVNPEGKIESRIMGSSEEAHKEYSEKLAAIAGKK